MTHIESRTLGQDADEFMGEETSLYMKGTRGSVISVTAFIAIAMLALYALPTWNSLIVDFIIVSTAGVLFFYVVPTLYRLRRLHLFKWVADNRTDKKRAEGIFPPNL